MENHNALFQDVSCSYFQLQSPCHKREHFQLPSTWIIFSQREIRVQIMNMSNYLLRQIKLMFSTLMNIQTIPSLELLSTQFTTDNLSNMSFNVVSHVLSRSAFHTPNIVTQLLNDLCPSGYLSSHPRQQPRLVKQSSQGNFYSCNYVRFVKLIMTGSFDLFVFSSPPCVQAVLSLQMLWAKGAEVATSFYVSFQMLFHSLLSVILITTYFTLKSSLHILAN